MSWDIVRLHESHERDEFTCGVPSLDEFLRQYVTQYEKRNLGRTYVLVRYREPRVFGYYTLAGGQISKADLPKSRAKKLPNHPIPVILLARLAVDQSVRGQKLGRDLLANAVARSSESAEQIGMYAVVVDAIDESAAAFYQKHAFTPLIDQPLRLFFPIASVPGRA